MNLTEPQAGSDLALVRTRAEPQPDGTYKIFGTKIFITYGEHDMAENIVHLVLARVTGAPEGVKGISLFVVPKFLVNADGIARRAQRRALRVSIEHKLGIKASPTAVLQFGDHGGADRLPGRRGEPRPRVHVHHDERGPLRRRHAGHRGGRARLPAGRGLSPRTACSRARSTARSPASAPIIHHPDVRRMLMTMRAYTEGCRAMALRRRGGLRRRAPPSRRRGAQAEPGLLRIHGAAGQGLQHRDEPGGRLAWACRCTAAWASSRRPARRSTTATPRS